MVGRLVCCDLCHSMKLEMSGLLGSSTALTWFSRLLLSLSWSMLAESHGSRNDRMENSWKCLCRRIFRATRFSRSSQNKTPCFEVRSIFSPAACFFAYFSMNNDEVSESNRHDLVETIASSSARCSSSSLSALSTDPRSR